MSEKKRVIIFDLECMHINWGANLGNIFCMAWKVLGEKKTHLESITDFSGKDILDDSRLVARIKEILDGADMWITYYGTKFDVPFIQTRLLVHGMKPLAPVAHKDLFYTIKFKFKFDRNRLLDVQNFLQLEESKTPVRLEKWLAALVGRKGALDEIEEHCIQDVKVLELAYEKVLPFMTTHPRLQGYGVCNKCAGTLLKNKIYYTSDKNHKITMKCQKCGGYETRRLTAKEQESFASTK